MALPTQHSKWKKTHIKANRQEILRHQEKAKILKLTKKKTQVS